jgi:hypothetical protein
MEEIKILPSYAKSVFLWKNCFIKDPDSKKFITAVELSGGGKGTYELHLKEFTGEVNQLFNFKYYPGKGYTWQSLIATEKWVVFTTSRSDYSSERQYKESGHPIWCFEWNNFPNQFWNMIQRVNDDTFVIRNMHSGLNLYSDGQKITQDRNETRWEIYSENVSLKLTKVQCLIPSVSTHNPAYIIDQASKELGVFIEAGRTVTGIVFPVFGVIDTALSVGEIVSNLSTIIDNATRSSDDLKIFVGNKKIWPDSEFQSINKRETKIINKIIATEPGEFTIKLVEDDKGGFWSSDDDNLGELKFKLSKLTQKKEYNFTLRTVKNDSLYILTLEVF